MLFQLVKKDFLIVKKYVLLMVAVCILFPIFLMSRSTEYAGILGYVLVTVISIFMLLQYVSIKETQYPKASTLLCALPFSRKSVVLSKYIFCIVIYAGCSLIFWLEALIFPVLQTVSYKIPVILFLILSICLGIYFPIQFKLGYERTKMFFVVVIMASPIGFAQFLKITENLNIEFLSNITPTLLLIGSLLISVVILIISSVISIKIYSKAELA